MWAMFQALLVLNPSQCLYWTDCLPLQRAVKAGPGAANDARNILARVHNMLVATLDDCDPEVIGWMPAHLVEADLHLEDTKKSDGSRVTRVDLEMNNLADELAKEGVEIHRVPAAEVKRWGEEHERVKNRAKWIGMVNHHANNTDVYPYSDSEAARWKAVAAQRKKEEAKRGIDGRRRRGNRKEEKAVLPENGGHTVVQVATGRGWVCSVCRTRAAKKGRLISKHCKGNTVKSWASGEGGGVGGARGGSEGRGHQLRKSGMILWCNTCGAFAESRADRLRTGCLGAPPRQHGSGGVRCQLNRLRAGRHPVTNQQLPAATHVDGTAVVVSGYARLTGRVVADDGFIPYAPEVRNRSTTTTGATAAEKIGLRRGRILLKEACVVREARRKRRQASQQEANAIIESFSNGHDAQECHVCA